MLTPLFALFVLAGCAAGTQQREVSYIESLPTFFELRNGPWLTNKWIRRPENLLAIHETFKKADYNRLLGTLFSDTSFIIQDIYIKKNGYSLADSLVCTYAEPENAPKYYREFWARRRKEGNDSVVHIILKDIISTTQYKLRSGILALNADSTLWNDTLLQLLDIEYRYDTLTTELALKDFETLKRLGFHQSAKNLLYECRNYDNINWNRAELEKTLIKTDSFIYPWFQDDTK